jgi:hypothetical protein
MRITRLAGLALVAMLAMGLVVASGATAASSNPLFLPIGQAVNGTSGVSTLTAFGTIIECKKNVLTGGATVSSSLLIANIVVHYLECQSGPEGSSLRCTSIKNLSGGTPGLLVTNTLHGILGLILPRKEIGLLVLPVASKIWFELAETKNAAGELCSKETKVAGNIVGLIEPVGRHQTTGKLIFTPPNPTDFDLTHGLGLVEPGLTLFSASANLSQTEEVTFGESTEVT